MARERKGKTSSETYYDRSRPGRPTTSQKEKTKPPTIGGKEKGKLTLSPLVSEKRKRQDSIEGFRWSKKRGPLNIVTASGTKIRQTGESPKGGKRERGVWVNSNGRSPGVL